jgi:hypothetical protein
MKTTTTLTLIMAIFCLVSIVASPAGFQTGSKTKTQNSQIETNTDKFSGTTTIKLKPQTVLKDQETELAIGLNAKVGGTDAKRKIGIDFIGHTSVKLEAVSLIYLYIAVDGESIKERLYCTDARRPKDITLTAQGCYSAISGEELSKIAAGKTVEMKFGQFEIKFTPELLGLLREYNKVVSTSDRKSP